MPRNSLNLRDILPNRGELTSMLEQGYVRKQVRPTEPLMIFNYTERAMFGKVWNKTTRMCRGLIVNSETDEVVARPFPKFFNHGEDAADKIALDEPVIVTDKMDGSLGIMYWQPRARQWAIATRGSFASDQALHATAVLQAKYPKFRPSDDCTYLFEIVYPENRIVVNYGELDDLVLLGIVDIPSGAVTSFDLPGTWPGPQTELFPSDTLAGALALPPRPGAEGVVVRASGNRMIKLKQSDYIALHRAITGLSARSIYQAMGEGADRDKLKFGMPEEFWPFIETTFLTLIFDQDTIQNDAEADYADVVKVLDAVHGPYLWGRKQFAERVKDLPNRNLLFLLLDERDISEVVWKSLKPGHDGPFFKRGEDVS